MAALCAPILAEIEAIERDAAALGRDADALAAKAATPQARVSAAYQQRYNKAVQAERDARSAAAAISTAKSHATRAANDACQVSDAIIKNLADPAARARITDVQRSRAEAEQDVMQTAAALDRIRAAHAAVIAANSLQTPLTLEFHGLKTRAGNLKRRRDAIVEKASELGDFNTAITLVVAQLASYNRQATAETKNAPPHAARARATRIAALLDRANKIDRTCVSRIRPTTLTMDAARNGADAKITNAASAIFDKTGVLAEPPNIGPEIERIFNAARTEAEAVAAEAVKAVRCEAAARNALANPPACAGAPPPGAVLKPDRPGGLTCKYQCGSSYIEFTVFDGTTTCPPKIEDYTLVGSSKSLPPAAGALVQSGAAWVKKGTTTRSGVQEHSNEFTATTARQVEVDGTVYRRDIQWTFTAPPVSLSPGEEIRIDVSGKVQTTDNGKAVKLPNAPSAGVRVRGLEKVSGELAWANTGEGKNSTYVFRVPADAKGATIELAADWNLGTFAVYAYGDHKKPP